MLKSALFASLFLALTLVAPNAVAQDWCGPPIKENIAAKPTPGKWYRLTGPVAKKDGQRALKRVFGDQAENVRRASRRDYESIKSGQLLCVPVTKPGEVWTPLPQFYEPAKDLERYVLVDVERQFLGAYERGRLVYSYPVATGKRGKDSPLGHHQVYAKSWVHYSSIYRDDSGRPCPMMHAVKYYRTKRKGGGDMWTHQGTLPGHRASHGCIRSSNEDSAWFFRWAQVGDPIDVVPRL